MTMSVINRMKLVECAEPHHFSLLEIRKLGNSWKWVLSDLEQDLAKPNCEIVTVFKDHLYREPRHFKWFKRKWNVLSHVQHFDEEDGKECMGLTYVDTETTFDHFAKRIVVLIAITFLAQAAIMRILSS